MSILTFEPRVDNSKYMGATVHITSLKC